MKKCFLVGLMLVLIIGACEQPRPELGTKVQTQAGLLEGLEDSTVVKSFLGIAYAEAPVGELRWKAPQLVRAWEGVRMAKTFGDDPMQNDLFGDMQMRGAKQSEDCLYLNVWTPAKYADENLPVFIYFNGGGLMCGSGTEPRYDGYNMAQKGIVCVTASVRQGIFGYIAHPELTAESDNKVSGNYGFLDMVAAIQWVKDNIKAFGGNPDHITICGESAGSLAVTVLMSSPLSKNNIAGAMLSSGACYRPYLTETLAEAEVNGVKRLEDVGLHSVAEARALSADSLMALLPSRSTTDMAKPVIDGYLLTKTVGEIFAAGEQAQVPLLAGWNSMESHPMQDLKGLPPTIENYKKVMGEIFGDMAEEILDAYGVKEDTDLMGENGWQLSGSLLVSFAEWKLIDWHAKAAQPVYRYRFNRAPSNPNSPMKMGAYHSLDIEYAMGNLDSKQGAKWTEDDYAVSETFMNYYANFIKTGNPNGEGLPEWTALNGKADEELPVMHIDVKTEQKTDNGAIQHAYRTLDKFYSK